MICQLRRTEHDPPCGKLLLLLGYTDNKELPVYACPACDAYRQHAKGQAN